MSELSSRYNLGSTFLLARLLSSSSSPSHSTSEATPAIIGTVEINPYDFQRVLSSIPPVNRSTYAFGAEKKLYLGDLAVRSDMRSKGIGSRLLSVIDEIALANHYEEIYLHVEDQASSQLLSFYRRNGYHLQSFTEASYRFTELRLSLPAKNYLLLRKSLLFPTTSSDS